MPGPSVLPTTPASCAVTIAASCRCVNVPATLTTTPLAFQLPSQQAHWLLAIFGLLQPHPTVADMALTGCLFLCHPQTASRMRLVTPIVLIGFVPGLLLPTMRHLWLQAGTGNANFYYFQTVILNVLMCVFVLQFGAASVKRRKALSMAFVRRRKELEAEDHETTEHSDQVKRSVSTCEKSRAD